MLSSPRFQDLRRRYPVFRYERFEIQKNPTCCVARFQFSIPPDISFTPEVIFESVAEGWHPAPNEAFRNAIFHLGLIELFSYWKATASPQIEIHAGNLAAEQVRWWEDLLIHGMGEFFYANDIDFTARDFVRIIPKPAQPDSRIDSPYRDSLPARSLLMIGGGRDSALAGGLLRNAGEPFTCMLLNPSTAARTIAGMVSSTEPVVIRRSICPELLQLNRKGFLNGHTPFSAYLAFLGAACLLLYGYSNVIVANERSSDEGNVTYRGREINHQYSKTYRFETWFDQYLRKYLVTEARYFSFVRPLYELQIGRLFSKFPKFFNVFKSCNRKRSDSWCGECPKCISVFLTMYPFVDTSVVTKIFGADLFYRNETVPVLRQLAGLEIKPFECVATTDEIFSALALSIAKIEQSGQPLPPVLAYAVEHIPVANRLDAAAAILKSYGTHQMPAAFENILRSCITLS